MKNTLTKTYYVYSTRFTNSLLKNSMVSVQDPAKILSLEPIQGLDDLINADYVFDSLYKNETRILIRLSSLSTGGGGGGGILVRGAGIVGFSIMEYCIVKLSFHGRENNASHTDTALSDATLQLTAIVWPSTTITIHHTAP